MVTFGDYKNRFKDIRLERQEDILEVTIHLGPYPKELGHGRANGPAMHVPVCRLGRGSSRCLDLVAPMIVP